jgi:hypothetical protein
MSPFKVLYGRKSTTPISWVNLFDRIMVGPEILQEMERLVKIVQQNLKEAQERHIIYANMKRRHHEFKIGEHVYLKVKERRSSLNIGSCCKLVPRICGPFEILNRIRAMAYQLALPTNRKHY